MHIFHEKYTGVGIHHVLHSSTRSTLGRLSARADSIDSKNSSGNLPRLSKKMSSALSFEKSTTILPNLLIPTSVPVNLNSFGKRTAWLFPLANNFAVCIVITSTLVYTKVATLGNENWVKRKDFQTFHK